MLRACGKPVEIAVTSHSAAGVLIPNKWIIDNLLEGEMDEVSESGERKHEAPTSFPRIH